MLAANPQPDAEREADEQIIRDALAVHQALDTRIAWLIERAKEGAVLRRALDAAKAAFERWADTYEHGGNPERHIGAATLLDALHACGVSDKSPSMWGDGRRAPVELICFADNGLDFIAVFKVGEENCFMPKAAFLKRFKPLVGDGARTNAARDAGKGETL